MALLLEKGPTVDRPDQWGTTALHHAARCGSPSMVESLIQARACVSERDIEQSTPLHEAMKAAVSPLRPRTHQAEQSEEHRNLRKKVKMLLDAGADVNANDKHGHTPLETCSIYWKETVSLLLQYDVNTSTCTRMLRKLVLRDNFSTGAEIAQWLVDRGTNINSGTVPELDTEDFTVNEKKINAKKLWDSFMPIGPWPASIPRPIYCGKELKFDGSGNARISGTYLVGLPRKEETNVLISLANNGPDDPDRLIFLIRNGIDLPKFGAVALLRAICNGNSRTADGLLDHDVFVALDTVRRVLRKLVKLEIADRTGDDEGSPDEQQLYDEVARDRGWDRTCERIAVIKNKSLI